MANWPPWYRPDAYDLAQYVTAEAEQLLDLGTDRFSLAVSDDGKRRIASKIYDVLLGCEIVYDQEPYTPDANFQTIRAPSDMLKPPHQGTCLDLATLFAGLCLANRLIPILIVLEGHALVAISLTHWLDQWDAPLRPKGGAFRNPVTDLRILRELLDDGDIFAVECTGFAHSEALERTQSANAPETQGRDKGAMTFARALTAGAEQLRGSRPLLFAIDIAVARYVWKKEAFRIEPPSTVYVSGQLTRLKYLLKHEEILPDALCDAFLAATENGALPAAPGEEGLLPRMIDDLGSRPPEAMVRFLNHLLESAPIRTPDAITAWIVDQPALRGCKVAAEPQKHQLDEPVVLIKVMPAAEDPSTMLVDAWLYHQSGMPPQRIDASPSITELKHSLSALPDAIEALVTRSQDYLSRRTTALNVELLLPIDLLGSAVEKWNIKVGKLRRRTLGEVFTVALRSYDRLYDFEYRRTWARWNQSWREIPDPLSEATVLWAVSANDWNEQVFDALRERGRVFVALVAGGANELSILLDAGAPIALWFRQEPADKHAVRARLRALICDRPATLLPSQIHMLRSDLTAPEWEALALLYDDPTRVPPDVASGLRAIQ